MTPVLDFDFENMDTVEFGIGRKSGDDQTFVSIPINNNVKSELKKYARSTRTKLQNDEGEPQEYDPSNETPSTKYIYLPINNEMAHVFRELQQAENLRIISNLPNLSDIFCYFTRFTDGNNRRLTAVRKTTQFTSLGKGHIFWFQGTLKLVENPIFKLDAIFDLLIDSQYIHVLHPKSFESVGDLRQFILNSVNKNTEIIQEHLQFVNLNPAKQYAATHIRAARYLASIRAHDWADNIDKSALEQACLENNVIINQSGDLIDISEDVGGFLEVLDRRRYNVTLVRDTPEQFKAASRHIVST